MNYLLQGAPGTPPTQEDVVEGLSFVVAARPAVRPGFTFMTWSDGLSSYSPGSTYTMGLSNVIFSAIWSRNVTHTVRYSVGSTTVAVPILTSGSAGGVPLQEDVPEGASFILASDDGFVRVGFTFSKWSDGTASFDAGSAYTMGSNNVVLTAVWTLKPSRTVTYNLAGGVGVLPTQAPVIQGLTFRTASSAGFSREGFTFSNWSNGSVFYAEDATYTVSTTNIVLTAVWSVLVNRTVTYSLAGGIGTLPTQANVAVGNTFVVADDAGITRTGFVFTSWSDGARSLAPGAIYTVAAGNVVLNAVWAPVVLRTVTYNLGGGSGTLPRQSPAGSGSEITLPDNAGIARNGFTFSSWSDGTTNYAPEATYTVRNSNVTFTAVWSQAATRSIRYTLNGGTGAIPIEPALPSGAKFIIADDAGITRDGFAFSAWSDGNDRYLPGATYTVSNSNIVLAAVWIAAAPRTITYTLGGGTGNLPIQASAPTGTTFSIAVAATISRTGFAFAGWSDGVQTFQPGSTYTVGTSNIVLTAQWSSAITRTITYQPGGGFGTKPGQTAVAMGASFVVAASTGLTKTGSSFGSWSDGANNYAPGDRYTVGSSDVTLTAVWIAALTRSVTYSLGGGVGTLPTQSPVAEGVTFRIAPSTGITRTGFTFVGWSNGGTGTFLPGSTSKMGMTDIILTAIWRSK